MVLKICLVARTGPRLRAVTEPLHLREARQGHFLGAGLLSAEVWFELGGDAAVVAGE